jgi:hypothetical protein
MKSQASRAEGDLLVVEEWRASNDPDVVGVEVWRKPTEDEVDEEIYSPMIKELAEWDLLK